MTTFERIKQLAKDHGISIKRLSKDLGFGASTIYKWKDQEPKAVDLQKVAKHFGVSIDYLLGVTTQKESKIDSDLNKAIDNARSFDGKPISDKDREKVKNILRGYFED